MVSPSKSTLLSSSPRVSDTLPEPKLSQTINTLRYSIVDLPSVHVDNQAADQHRHEGLTFLERQVTEQKSKLRSEYDVNESAIRVKSEHELATLASTIELSRQNSLYQLENQHRVRVFQIEQMALEQKLRIEGSAGKLLLEASQQKLSKHMHEKMLKFDDHTFVETRSNMFDMNNTTNVESPVFASRALSHCPNCGTSLKLG